jgi:galactokinase
MQRRAEQFLRQRFGLTDEQSRQFTQLRREHMRSAIETQGQINSLRQNLLLRVQDFAPSPNDVKDQQERLAQVDRAISELQKTEEYQELEQQLLELERRNLKHMVQLRALMNADQVKQFDVTMPRYLFRFQQGSGGPAGGSGVGPGGGGPDGRGPGGNPNRRPGS